MFHDIPISQTSCSASTMDWSYLALHLCSSMLDYFLVGIEEWLLTKDRMLHFGMTIFSIHCILCRSMPETAQHLFMNCPYLSTLIAGIGWPITTNWTEMLEGNICVGNVTRIEKLCSYLAYSVMVYVVWRERNSRIHDQQTRSMSTNALLHDKKAWFEESCIHVPLLKKLLPFWVLGFIS